MPFRRASLIVRFALLCLPIAGCGADGTSPVQAPAAEHAAAPGNDALTAALKSHAAGAEVEGEGRVEHVLRDDARGSPHQKFLLRVGDGTTLLVAHNIGIAPRLDGLADGDTVAFRGEYVWNAKGGTLHWTHRDPQHRHPDGWLRWRGRTYD